MSVENARAHALPFIGDGPVPAHLERRVEDDDSGLGAVLALFLRAWPYVRPMVLGQWFTPGKGVDERVAGLGGDSGYGDRYALLLIAAVAIAGPLSGWVPATWTYPSGLLYALIAGMAGGMTAFSLADGRTRIIGGSVTIACAIGANLVATFVVSGLADGFYTAAVTAACIAGWMLQFRVDGGRLGYRLRLHAHLVYYYALVWFQRFIDFAAGLLLADLLNQSILQAAPMMPAVAALVGAPEMGAPELASGLATTLSDAQRHELKWIYLGIFLAFAVVTLQLTVVAAYYRVWILQRLNQVLRLALVERWHQLSLGYHSDHRVGDSIFRIYQDSAQVTAVIDRLMGIATAAITFLTAVVLVTLLSPWIGLITVSLLAPAIIWSRWAMPRMRVRSLAARAAASDVTSRIQESFAAIRVIKAYGAEERAQARFEADSIASFNATYRVRMLIAFVTIIMFTLTSAFILGGEFLMATWANLGADTFANELIALVGVSFTVWNLTAFNWTREQFHSTAGSVRLVLRQWLSAQDIAMGLRRVFDILDLEPDVKDAADAVPLERFESEIRFDAVGFRYQHDRPVLADVSFAATPGSITAIVGPTGTGKSTLMALLLRLHDPSSGAIRIDGRDLRQYQVQSLRRNVAIALQENMLFSMSVRDNIRYVAPAADDATVQRAVRVACMEDYVDGLPNGLDTMLGDRGGKLSTGQRQRLSIARAVVRDTPILILDEPTAALDAATEHRVMQNLATWGKERAIFLITHRISTIRRADNILYLDAGTIIESGNHEALMQIAGGRYRAFVEAESTLSQRTSPAGEAP